MRAESVKIESEEDGFHLVIETDSAPRIDINVQNVALELLSETLRMIGPWAEEGAQVLREMRQLSESVDDLDSGDPKHPDHVEAMTP